MKLVRFGEKDAERPGILDAEGHIRDLSGVAPDFDGAGLSPAALAQIAGLDVRQLPLAPAGARLGPCVARPGKVLCIGKNFKDHAAEMNSPVPSEPLLFMKATSAVNGPFDDVPIPRGSVKVDYEGELALVIGRRAKYVARAEALSYVAGYFIMNDVSERAFQNERGGQMTKGKSCDGFAPMGPWLVSADEVPDPQALSIRTKVDDELRQDGSTADMVFPVAEIISYLSQFFTLYPGDVISTGTPHGVAAGMTPPGWVRAGQHVSVAIEGLGELRNRFIADA